MEPCSMNEQEKALVNILNGLLDRIEEDLMVVPEMTKERAQFETERMYLHNAMLISLEKLGGKRAAEAKEGISRSRELFKKISESKYS